MKQIGVTRFTDETYEENKRWKQSREYNGSIYGFDREVSIDNFNYMGTIYTIDIRCSPNTKKSPPHIYGIGVIRFFNTHNYHVDVVLEPQKFLQNVFETIIIFAKIEFTY